MTDLFSEIEIRRRHAVIKRITGQIPRRILADYPTPLLRAKRLEETLGGAELWFKRDDLISFGLGGNKIRGLEVLLADALARRADWLVTGAGVQSNHVRATAAVAAHEGLGCSAVFWGKPPPSVDGNYRMTRMLEAEIRFTGDDDRESVDRGIAKAAAELSEQGRRPYAIPRGGACLMGHWATCWPFSNCIGSASPGNYSRIRLCSPSAPEEPMPVGCSAFACCICPGNWKVTR